MFVTGTSRGRTSGFDYATVAYNAATGARRWASRYNGPKNADDGAVSVAAGPGGRSVFVTGTSPGRASGMDYATIAYNAATGAPRWTRRYNGPASGADTAPPAKATLSRWRSARTGPRCSSPGSPWAKPRARTTRRSPTRADPRPGQQAPAFRATPPRRARRSHAKGPRDRAAACRPPSCAPASAQEKAATHAPNRAQPAPPTPAPGITGAAPAEPRHGATFTPAPEHGRDIRPKPTRHASDTGRPSGASAARGPARQSQERRSG